MQELSPADAIWLAIHMRSFPPVTNVASHNSSVGLEPFVRHAFTLLAMSCLLLGGGEDE